MNERVLITSALLYANGPLHFGHVAGAYLPADVYARFMRLLGNDVFYLSGSDEYGVAITMSAEIAGRTPKEQVDLFHNMNKELFHKLNFSFDHYSRTTWDGHSEPVQRFFLDLMENGYIEERVTEELYSPEDDRFLADRYVMGTCPKCGFEKARGDECPSCSASFDAGDLIDPKSKLTGASLTKKATKHWFLRLDMLRDKLTKWVETLDLKPNVLNFVKRYIEDLRARSITRDSSWGIPVPLENAEGKVVYVWFDAPIGYLTAMMEWAKKEGRDEEWKDWWLNPKTRLVHFIGKDNIPFHAVIFPAMCMGQNLPITLVQDLPANEFLNLEGKQFSKSEGWMIDLADFMTRYSSDQVRYVLAANAPETQDSEFSFKDFLQKCNGDLVGKWGNLIHRSLSFIHNKVGDSVPAAHKQSPEDIAFLEQIKALREQAREAYSSYKLRKAVATVMELAQSGNIYFDQKKPWVLAKDPEKKEELETTLNLCLECLKVLALISFPIIPDAANKLWNLLGYETSLEKAVWEQAIETPIPVGQKLQQPEIIFQKIEEKMIATEIEALHATVEKQEISYEPLKEQISIDDVWKVDLRVGLVQEAEKVPKSSKLLKLQVSLGFETRQIVAGIGKTYSPDDLVGKKVVVVANLKPAKLMGVESQGMVLAGGNDKLLELPSIQELPPGSVVS